MRHLKVAESSLLQSMNIRRLRHVLYLYNIYIRQYYTYGIPSSQTLLSDLHPLLFLTRTGSRPGGPVAATWAAMRRFGEDGYVETTREIVGATRRIAEGAGLVGDGSFGLDKMERCR